jgi:hypothetical protein
MIDRVPVAPPVAAPHGHHNARDIHCAFMREGYVDSRNTTWRGQRKAGVRGGTP